MAFGFDSSIPLSAPQTPEASLGDFVNAANAGVQRKVEQARLGDLLYKHQREMSLVDIVRQNARAYDDPYASALASGGFGDEADARQRLAQAFAEHHLAIRRSQAPTIKTPEQYAQWISNLPPEQLSQWGLTDKFDPKALEAFAATGLPVDKQGDYLDAQRQRTAMADPTSLVTAVRAGLGKRLGLEIPAGTPGNAISKDVLDDAERMQAAELRARAMGLPGPGGSLPQISNPALDIQVTNAVKTGDVPKFGSGPLGLRQKAAFWNRLAELYPDADLAGNKASYRANLHSYKEGQAQADVQDVKEAKALADIQVLRGTMKGLFNSGSPLINAVGRKFQEMSGDPDYAAFRTAREMALPTINATVNSGQLSVGAREEIKDLLRKDDSIASMDKALGIIEQDMARSKQASHQRISNVRARLSAKPGTAPPEDNPPGASAAPPASGGMVTVRRKSDGKVKTLPADAAAKYLQSPDFEAVK